MCESVNTRKSNRKNSMKKQSTKTNATATATTVATATNATATVATNATKTNDVYAKLYAKMVVAKCKLDLVNACNMVGIRTNTTPTTTPNKNDLYFQLFDKSRVLITSKSLKVYTNNDHATALHTAYNDFEFDDVNDGSYRTKRATVKNTVENFTKIMSYFEKCGCIAYLPQIEK